jgi:hypothetical protein
MGDAGTSVLYTPHLTARRLDSPGLSVLIMAVHTLFVRRRQRVRTWSGPLPPREQPAEHRFGPDQLTGIGDD